MRTVTRILIAGTDFVAGGTSSSPYRVSLDTGPGTSVVYGPRSPALNVTQTLISVDLFNPPLTEGTAYDVVLLADGVEIGRVADAVTSTVAPTPTVSDVSPVSAVAGTGAVFTVTGSGFVSPFQNGVGGVQWTLILYPAGTTSSGVPLRGDPNLANSETEITTQPATTTLGAGTYDAYIAANSSASSSTLTSYANAQWTGGTIEITSAVADE